MTVRGVQKISRSTQPHLNRSKPTAKCGHYTTYCNGRAKMKNHTCRCRCRCRCGCGAIYGFVFRKTQKTNTTLCLLIYKFYFIFNICSMKCCISLIQNKNKNKKSYMPLPTHISIYK